MNRTALAIAIFYLMASQGFANNNFFIPGDAFFYFEIEQSEWEDLKNGNLTTVNYDRPDHLPRMFCGYAGYQKLDISNLPIDYRARLIQSIEAMKESYPTEAIETDHGESKYLGSSSGIKKQQNNKIRIFVYNKTFDFSQYRLGLKYNESWPDFAVVSGHKKDLFQFDFFVDTPKGITESWRMGDDVSPLDAIIPPVGEGYIEKPIRVDPDKIKFLVAPPVSLAELCFPPRDSAIKCIAVSSDGAQSLMVDKSGRSIWIPIE